MVASTHDSTRVVCECYTFWKCFLGASGLQGPYKSAWIHLVNIEASSDIIDDTKSSTNIYRRIPTVQVFSVALDDISKAPTHIRVARINSEMCLPSVPPHRYRPPLYSPNTWRSPSGLLSNAKAFGMMSLSAPYPFENTGSNLQLLKSNNQTWTHLSCVPITIQAVPVLGVSTVMQSISPPFARRAE